MDKLIDIALNEIERQQTFLLDIKKLVDEHKNEPNSTENDISQNEKVECVLKCLDYIDFLTLSCKAVDEFKTEWKKLDYEMIHQTDVQVGYEMWYNEYKNLIKTMFVGIIGTGTETQTE